MVATWYDGTTASNYSDCTATTSTFFIVTSCSSTNNPYIHPGYTANDGHWFSDYKEYLRWNNILHERSIWWHDRRPPPPKTVKLISKRFAVRNYQSSRQQYKSKRKSYLQGKSRV